MLTAAQLMISNFLKNSVNGVEKREYCQCSKIINYRYSRTGGKFFKPFSGKQTLLDQQCNVACSNSIVLEFE